MNFQKIKNKKIKMIKKTVFIALLALGAIACKKVDDSENPVITIFTPTTNQEFESADSVTINRHLTRMIVRLS